VESVVAGRISKIKHRYPSLSVTLQTSTVSGVKCLARIGQAVQELFIVTGEPAGVEQRLKERWG
jgi:3-deoxy-D-manno-octulosonic-acid transferase